MYTKNRRVSLGLREQVQACSRVSEMLRAVIAVCIDVFDTRHFQTFDPRHNLICGVKKNLIICAWRGERNAFFDISLNAEKRTESFQISNFPWKIPQFEHFT